MTAALFTGTIVPCPLCGGEHHTGVSETDRRGNPLRTVLCTGCGHVFTNPQPTPAEIKDYYKKRYRNDYKGVATPKLKHVYRAGLRALERFSDLEPHCHRGMRVFDIGSGGGEFVYLMQSLGFQAKGLEPNQGYAAFSREAYGTDVSVGALEDVTSSAAVNNVVTLHHVLEHLANPIESLKRLGELLSDNGLLVVEVPNVEARYHGPRRQYHFAHLHSFSVEGLDWAGFSAGFESFDITLQPHTRHISAMFKKKPGSAKTRPDSEIAKRIETSHEGYTPIRDSLSVRPYRKMWANLKRPVKERLAIAKLGNPISAKDLLDRLYAPTVQAFSASLGPAQP